MDECKHCEHVDQLWIERQFAAQSLKFVAIATPIILALATFIVLVTQ